MLKPEPIVIGSKTFTIASSQQLNTVARAEQTFAGQLAFDFQAATGEINYPLMVTGKTPLSPAYRYSFENIQDENGNPVLLSDYIDTSNKVIRNGRLSAQIRSNASGTLNIGTESLTPERVFLSFVVLALPAAEKSIPSLLPLALLLLMISMVGLMVARKR